MRPTALFVICALLATGLILAGPHAAGAASLRHTVRAGENLYRIALRYGVSVEAIARANGLADPERIYPGLVLTIPKAVSDDRAVRRPAASKPAVKPQTASIPRSVRVARSYRVQRGDTLSAIARRFRVSVPALKRANGLRSDRIRPGQVLRIPGRRTRLSSGPPLPVQPVVIPPLPVQRTTEVLPIPSVGEQILAPQALRLRRGPKSYFATLTLVAPETPLTVVSVLDKWYEVQLPEGETGWVYEDVLRIVERVTPADPSTIRGADIVQDARRYLGVRYRWGGTSGRSLDCSGFVYLVFSERIAGLARLRSYDYFRMGAPVVPEDLLPGDLVFFTTYAPGPSHVGIYIGEGNFIHASSGAGKVVVSPLTDEYYASRYLGARRLLKP